MRDKIDGLLLPPGDVKALAEACLVFLHDPNLGDRMGSAGRQAAVEHWDTSKLVTTACSPQRSLAVNDGGIAAEAAATTSGGGQYADITELFCTGHRCPVIVGNNLVYRDDNHVTIEYAQALRPVMAALADRAILRP